MTQAWTSGAMPTKRSRSMLRDKALLLGAALLVCLIGGAAFLLGEIYHVNPAWIFFAWNSIFMIPMLAREFRGYWKKPAFIIFFLVWMAVHGFVVVSLMRWVSLVYWPIFILLELSAGFVTAHWLFGVSLNQK